jgi:hypothetical protein
VKPADTKPATTSSGAQSQGVSSPALGTTSSGSTSTTDSSANTSVSSPTLGTTTTTTGDNTSSQTPSSSSNTGVTALEKPPTQSSTTITASSVTAPTSSTPTNNLPGSVSSVTKPGASASNTSSTPSASTVSSPSGSTPSSNGSGSSVTPPGGKKPTQGDSKIKPLAISFKIDDGCGSEYGYSDCDQSNDLDRESEVNEVEAADLTGDEIGESVAIGDVYIDDAADKYGSDKEEIRNELNDIINDRNPDSWQLDPGEDENYGSEDKGSGLDDLGKGSGLDKDNWQITAPGIPRRDPVGPRAGAGTGLSPGILNAAMIASLTDLTINVLTDMAYQNGDRNRPGVLVSVGNAPNGPYANNRLFGISKPKDFKNMLGGVIDEGTDRIPGTPRNKNTGMILGKSTYIGTTDSSAKAAAAGAGMKSNNTYCLTLDQNTITQMGLNGLSLTTDGKNFMPYTPSGHPNSGQSGTPNNHVTIYPVIPMSLDEFNARLADLPWRRC